MKKLLMICLSFAAFATVSLAATTQDVPQDTVRSRQPKDSVYRRNPSVNPKDTMHRPNKPSKPQPGTKTNQGTNSKPGEPQKKM